MTLIDSHCHLDFPEFEAERDVIVARARAAGLVGMVTIATRVARHEQLRAIAERYPDVFFTVGTHPLQAGEEPDVALDIILACADHPRCVAIGEAGLDYHYDPVPRDLAAKVFRRQIEAARRSGLPLVIHSRDADDDMAAILRDEMGREPFAAVLHCFTGSRALAEVAVELGLSISFSGVVTFKNSGALRDIARNLPADRILVETDAPFLAPQPYRGKRNEPGYVVHTAAVLAEARGETPEAFAARTVANTLRLFGKIRLPETVA